METPTDPAPPPVLKQLVAVDFTYGPEQSRYLCPAAALREVEGEKEPLPCLHLSGVRAQNVATRPAQMKCHEILLPIQYITNISIVGKVKGFKRSDERLILRVMPDHPPVKNSISQKTIKNTLRQAQQGV